MLCDAVFLLQIKGFILPLREWFTGSYVCESSALLHLGPLFSCKLSLATVADLRDTKGMPPDLIALFLLTCASSALTIAVVMYNAFPRPETRFTLIVTLFLVYVLLTLAPLVFLPHPMRK
jgi:hypothetical protein